MTIFLRALPVMLGVCLGLLPPPSWAQKVRLATTAGDIVVELDRAKAPKTVDNFLAYVKAGHYNGTIFHRVIPGFMIQGGGFEPGMKQKATGAPIKNEADNKLKNDRYTIAMARTGDSNGVGGPTSVS